MADIENDDPSNYSADPGKPDVREPAKARAEEPTKQSGKPHPTRWQKGCPSPNPGGRPPKRKPGTSLLAVVDPEQANFLAADRKVLGQDADGHNYTRGDSIISQLFLSARNDPRMMKLYLEQKNRASDEERRIKETILAEAIRHQDKWLQHAQFEDSKGNYFSVLPHPLDILIEGNDVRIVGPVTLLEQQAVMLLLKQRQFIHDAVPLILEATHTPVEFRHKLWLQLRRRHYRLQAKIPPRLHRPFPKWKELPMVVNEKSEDCDANSDDFA
jgi:hypothetical protein